MKLAPKIIVLILGNGFDLDLGLKTSYKDFWKSEFCPKNYPAPLIKHLNQCWPNDINAVRWYDLETEILNYYNLRNTNPDYPDVVSNELLEYLRTFDNYRYVCDSYASVDRNMEELVHLGYAQYGVTRMWVTIPYLEDYKQTPTWRDMKALLMIKEGLLKYLESLDVGQPYLNSNALRVLSIVSNAANDDTLVDIHTFNYTPVPLDAAYKDKIPIHYVHGSCERGDIIIGTKDDANIQGEYVDIQKSFDAKYYSSTIAEDLKDADNVIIFGHSLGLNDRQYFESFFQQQSEANCPERKRISIITKDDASERQIKQSLQVMTNSNLTGLFSHNDLRFYKTHSSGALDDDYSTLLE